MRQSDRFPAIPKDMELPVSEPITIVAEQDQISALRGRLDATWVSEAKAFSVGIDDDLPIDDIPGSGIVVIQVDPAVQKSMSRIATMRHERPDAAIIVALESADLKLVRTLIHEGVTDVVEIPIVPEDLYQSLVATHEARLAKVGVDTGLCPLVSVTRCIGGSGATTIVSHLAEAVAERGHSVCIFDLDIQFGRLADVFDLSPRRTLADLLEANERIDGALLRSVAASRIRNLSVIAAPTEILPLEAIEFDTLWRIIKVARQEYDYVFLDLPVGLTNWMLSILTRSDRIIMAVRQDLQTLRQTRRTIELFTRLGVDHRLISIAVNQVQRRMFGGIHLADVEDALGREVALSLPLDQQNIPAAQDQGKLVDEIKAKTPFAAEMRRFADEFLSQLEAERER